MSSTPCHALLCCNLLVAGKQQSLLNRICSLLLASLSTAFVLLPLVMPCPVCCWSLLLADAQRSLSGWSDVARALFLVLLPSRAGRQGISCAALPCSQAS